MTQMSFQRLLERAKQGDHDAWRGMVVIVEPYLVRRAAWLLDLEPRNNRVNDLLQDVWERAIRKIGSFKGGADDEQTGKMFCRWMARLMDHVYRHRKRHKGTKRRRPPRPFVPWATAPPTTRRSIKAMPSPR